MSSIKEEISTLAENVRKDLQYEKDTHTISSGEKNLYESHLPETLTMEVVEKVNGYDVAFVAATGLAVGEMAIEHMAKEKSVEQISAEFPMGKKNGVAHVVTRERVFTNITDAKNPVHKFGDLASTLTVQAGRNQGEFKKVRTHLHELGAEQLNSK